jgi:hypothetical protein
MTDFDYSFGIFKLFLNTSHTNTRKRIPKNQSKMDNPEKLAAIRRKTK